MSMTLQDTTDPTTALDEHVHSFFAGHAVETLIWDNGPIYQRVPGFRVHAIAPGARGSNAWTYVTAGCWQVAHPDGHGLEFVLATRGFTIRAVELLARNAYFHAGPEDQRLGLGHTVNLGEPWLPGSACDHGLVSLPYPWGPDLEWCEWRGGHAQLLWLLPITEAERDFKVEHGQEALEDRFHAARLDFTNPHRASLV
jgi:hypothetical protein